MSRFGLIGSFTAQPGQRDTLLAILRDAVASVEDAPGCELYVVNTAPDDPNSIWFMEIWRSKDDHAASLQDERTRVVIERAMPLIAGMGIQVTLEPRFGKGLPETDE